MPQDYFSQWSAALDGKPSAKGPEKKKAEPAPKDYYSEWSASLDSQPTPPKNTAWKKEVLPALLEGSPFLQRILASSGLPTAPIAQAMLPDRKPFDPKAAFAALKSQAVEMGRKSGLPNPNDVEFDPATFGFKKKATAPYKSVVEGVAAGSTPGNIIKEKGPGLPAQALEFGKGLVSFLPDLGAEFVNDPLGTIERRPLDVVFAAEGFAGPKVRARITNIKGKLAQGPISTEELGAIFKDLIPEAKKWNAPVKQTEALVHVMSVLESKPGYLVMPDGTIVPAGTKPPVLERVAPGAKMGAQSAPPVAATQAVSVSPNPPAPTAGFSLTNPEPTPPPFRPAAPYAPNIAAGDAVAQGVLPMADASALFAGKTTPPLSAAAETAARKAALKRALEKTTIGKYHRGQVRPEYGEIGFEERMEIGKARARARANAGLPPQKKNSYVTKAGEADYYMGKAAESAANAIREGKTTWRKLSEEERGLIKERYSAESVASLRQERGYPESWDEPISPRKVPGLGMVMVDSKGRPMTMAQYLAEKNGKSVRAAEDLGVALMGAKTKPSGEPAAPPPPGEGLPLTPQQQLVAEARAAKKLGPEQAAIYSKERGRRMGAFERQSSEQGLSGEARATARRASQAGEMEKVGWEPIREKFTPEAVDGFFNAIDRHPGLDGFDKLSTETALRKILDGQLPQPAEIDKLAVVFGKELADTLVAKRDMMSAGARLLYEAGNLPRSLMASYDLSAPLRQGIFMVSHPKLFGKAFKDMFGYWTAGKGKARFDALQESIVKRPNYLLMKKSGLGLTDVNRYLKGREEAFQSSIAEKLPGVKGSERAYVGFLNELRADTFDYLVKMADEKGLKPYEDLGVAKQIAGLVNNATGRGKLPGMAERAALALNSLFFSPRLMASRINLIWPGTYMNLPKHVRWWAVKTALADLGIAATVLGATKEITGASVSLDFNSPDFMKIKSGNTRIDVMGGFSQYYRVLAQSLDFLYKNYVKDEKVDKSALERLATFTQYKESPSATFVAGFLRGKNVQGDKFNIPSEVLSRIVPMMAQDIYDVLKDDPSRFPLVIPAAFGVGVQTYESAPKKRTAKTW